MRRAEKDNFFQVFAPRVRVLLGIVAGAARHQAAHAVRNNGQLFHLHRPCRHQRFKFGGEGATVAGNMQPSVVAKVDRRVAQIFLQCSAVIVRRAVRAHRPPLPVVHAQAVNQYQHLAGRLRDRASQTVFGEGQSFAMLAKLHGNCQRISGFT